jgi:outer membrane protein OmpA-like peptidoglycan-associated protein
MKSIMSKLALELNMKNKKTLNMEVRMYRDRTAIHSRRFMSLWLKRIFFNSLILICFHAAMSAQETQRTQPTWWYGGAAAVNLNFYGGTTQMLNSDLTTPAAFHKGFGDGLYLAALVEYRPDSVWGGILQVGYDDRRGSFNDVLCPCGEMSTLSADVSYLSIEPSLRFAPFADAFYIFGGPRIGFTWSPSSGDAKTFVYTQGTTIGTKAQFSSMNGTVFSGQIGIGYDFPLTAPNQKTQVELSPFISFQPYFGSEPRSVETWGVTTLRVGAALKFGSGDVIHQAEVAVAPVVVERDVQFSVRAPKAVPLKRRVRESFPLRNYVFFDEVSTEIPNRYVTLSKDQAASFKEEQLQEFQPKSFTGRAGRQMVIYYNILNITGDRMKRSPGTTITLSGASPAKGAEFGKARAETIKRYLVNVFGIDSSRITTEGRDKPLIPSESRGGTKELALLEAGDRRVDIESDSPEMLVQVGGAPHYMLKPVQVVTEVEDPLDSHVIFNVVGAKEALTSWSLEITDDQGKVQRFGPSTQEQESISGNAILGDRSQGDYKIVMLGDTKGGKLVRKESSVHLVRRDAPMKDVVRFRILFDFDKSKTVASYEKFITDIITPLIPDSGKVIIHGYTDIVGDEAYNSSLSSQRAQDVQGIIENAVAKSGKKGITYETFGFGSNLQYASFDNFFPEERFYNRSVIIDIVPD